MEPLPGRLTTVAICLLVWCLQKDFREHFSKLKGSQLSKSTRCTTTQNASSYAPNDGINGMFIRLNPRNRNERGIVKLCRALSQQPYPWRRGITSVPNDCQDQSNEFASSNITAVFDYCGTSRTGNMLSDLFFNRIIAASAGINFQVEKSSCTADERNNSAFAMLGDPVPFALSQAEEKADLWNEMCSSCDILYRDNGRMLNHASFPHSCRDIIFSVILPSLKEEFATLAERAMELHPQLKDEIDDVSIHLRLGDLLKGNERRADMGLLPFPAYLKLIPRHVKSIGIVTSPAAPESHDNTVIQGLTLYLGRHYPSASINVRNSANDTIPMVYTRLVEAKVATICTSSTFCTYPTLASKGRSIVIPSVLYGQDHPNWTDRLDEDADNGVHVPKVRFLASENFPFEDGSSFGEDLVDLLTDFCNTTDCWVANFTDLNGVE